ncbi:MAG: hypothetical protein EHM36_11035, partial [Deltaproteobacteria bacterium]
LFAGILLGMVLFISNLRRYLQERGKKKGKDALSPETMAVGRNLKKKIALSVILLLIYILVMPLVGFALSTFLYVTVFIFVLEERRRVVLVLSPVLVTGLVLLLFSRFITIPFPRGLGIFAAFSRLLY